MFNGKIFKEIIEVNGLLKMIALTLTEEAANYIGEDIGFDVYGGYRKYLEEDKPIPKDASDRVEDIKKLGGNFDSSTYVKLHDQVYEEVKMIIKELFNKDADKYNLGVEFREKGWGIPNVAAIHIRGLGLRKENLQELADIIVETM